MSFFTCMRGDHAREGNSLRGLAIGRHVQTYASFATLRPMHGGAVGIAITTPAVAADIDRGQLRGCVIRLTYCDRFALLIATRSGYALRIVQPRHKTASP
jgi:hypothetical protein